MAGVRATIFEDSIVIEERTLVSYKYVQTLKEGFFFKKNWFLTYSSL